ncbi:MAG: hypothetical protein ACFE89_04710 [Candidatus Hodarchaeota archaeon]
MEGFFGMLYIHETPIHFGLVIVTWIVLLYGVFVSFRAMIASEERKEWNWLTFLTLFFLLFTYSILAIMMYNLPATATADQLLPYYLGAWSCVALYAFFGIFLMFSVKALQLPQWFKYLFLIGTISFLVVLWLFTTSGTTTVVSDGVMHWLAMPLVVVTYGGVLAIIYMFIIPFIHTYRVTKEQGGSLKTGNWLAWFGLFLWDISAMCMAVVFFAAPIMPYALGLGLIGLILSYIGLTIATRAISKLK